MSYQFKVKTHVSLQKALEQLKITKEQFKSLLIHLKIHAENVRKPFRIGSEDTSYKISDINKIYNSDIYKALLINNKIAKKKNFYRQMNRDDLASKRSERRLDYVELIKKKYKTFSDAVHDLGESLTFLYIFQFFFKPQDAYDKNLLEMVNTELELFIKFCVRQQFIDQAYPSKKGIHFNLKIDCVNILFFVPIAAEDDVKFELEEELEHIKLYLTHLVMIRSRFENDPKLKAEIRDYKNKPENICIENTIFAKWLDILMEQMCISKNPQSQIRISDGTIAEKNEKIEYFHSAYVFALFNQNFKEKSTFKIGNFTDDDLTLCHPQKNETTFEKDFVDTLSKNKQQTIEDYLTDMKKEIFFD
ncbi:Protein required for normal rRNA processing [Pseudoloma neurophilia]|uniref:Protein required for normal rRNA processing n=1 Tax=Pseudoloma neurophilia TaxID=146866 RepID=A0A0R0M5C1_9MICR|nr:Protein required for normal rRNA processing [Pseudoloma neurophilia]